MAAKERKITLTSVGEYQAYWTRQLDQLRAEWRDELLNIDQNLPGEALINYSNPLSVEEAESWLVTARDKQQQVEAWLSEYKSAGKRRAITPLSRAQREIKIKERDFWLTVIRGLKQYRHEELQKRDNQIPMTEIEKLSRANRRSLGEALELLKKYIYLEGVSPEDLAKYLELQQFYDSSKIPKGSVINRTDE